MGYGLVLRSRVPHAIWDLSSHMMTSSNGNIFRVTGHLCGIHRTPVNSPHKGQWRGALMFSLICPWIYGWVKAGDLRCYRAHYDVIVMQLYPWKCARTGPLNDITWVSWRIDYLFNSLFRLTSRKTRNLCITDIWWMECAGDRWIPLTKGQ